MHSTVESNIVVTLASGASVKASAKTTVVAATGIAHAMTSVLNRFASVTPHKVSIHHVSAGATKSLSAHTRYARQSDTSTFDGISASLMPVTVIATGEVIVDQKFVKVTAGVGTVTLHKNNAKPIALKIIAGFASAFFTLIYFLSPVSIKMPSVHDTRLNTMIYIDAYKMT